MKNFLIKIKEYYGLNKASAIIMFFIGVILISSLLMMNTMANISSFWSVDIDEKPLPDIVHEILPLSMTNQGIVLATVDISMYSFLVFTVLAVLTRRDAVNIGIRMFSTISISYLLRILIVTQTNLPSPTSNCRKIVKNFLTEFGQDRCGDLIYSGHTIPLTICIYTWLTYSFFKSFLGELLKNILRTRVAILGYSTLFMIIICRMHYTIDVILAIYSTTSVWIIYGLIWNKYLINEKYFNEIYRKDAKIQKDCNKNPRNLN
ncbi:hypothetical protein EDEG_00991 [Edhazardia aedis USNM 41457]|uniref:Sphingomyelin synthase-like domain-containing protein n=1 Tax=Edhazardia aedis (strain USNM 41457) TaxID=1003232 RepID=J9DAN5_EDHAE|nr:hypothetical protein EDEG_00991 [Edhazardia aedis USNM 41457]|eukprot:EJW04821.1 hypothetical protein EDEG_00991 [Edhazardia aedis USNM 41457]